jgi:hypothetical protein
MIFTKRDLGKKLKEQIVSGRNANQIGKWAYSIFFENCRELEPELKEILEVLLLMENGPEFEYTEQELRLLAELLINEVEDPIKQINEIKSKELS